VRRTTSEVRCDSPVGQSGHKPVLQLREPLAIARWELVLMVCVAPGDTVVGTPI
jgi:hypothetical protein